MAKNNKLKTIPFGKPVIDNKEFDIVNKVLREIFLFMVQSLLNLKMHLINLLDQNFQLLFHLVPLVCILFIFHWELEMEMR